MSKPEETKKLLMVCYFYPPIRASGTARSVEFSKNLLKLGWDITILSVRNPKDTFVTIGKEAPPFGLKIERAIELPISSICEFLQGVSSKVLSLFGVDLKRNYFREFLALPDAQIGWIILPRLLKLARNDDIIYVSCSPFSASIFGVLAAKILRKPLICDFRDAWTLNPHIKHTRLHNCIISLLENYVLKNSSRLILNTPGAAKLYKEKYPKSSTKILAIPNGFDELTPVTKQNDVSGPFVIMHVGSFYETRSPKLLLQALSELPDLNIEFVQIGGEILDKEHFEGKVKMREFKEKFSREQALNFMQQASLLYLKQGWEDGVANYIAVAAKTYEYLATGLPILAEVPPGDNADVIADFGVNSYVITSTSLVDLKAAIVSAYEARDRIVPRIKDEFISTFSRVALSQKLDRTLQEILSEHR